MGKKSEVKPWAKLPERRKSEVLRTPVTPAIKQAVESTAAPGEVAAWVREAVVEKLQRDGVVSSAGAT